MRQAKPDLVLLDLGLGGSTTVGVDICRQLHTNYNGVKVLIFTGEILNERLWVEALQAGADGIRAYIDSHIPPPNSPATVNGGWIWNRAAKKAASYLRVSSFSRSGLIEQLEFEGFTYDQAVYGAVQVGY